MRKIILILGVVYTTNIIAIESIYDGTGSLINPNEQCWGCNQDEARMHPHKDKNSTVTFQWMHDATKCEHIDISASSDLGQDVKINLKGWNSQQTENSYRVRLPVQDNGISLKTNNYWTVLSISTTQPLNKQVSIFAYCRGPDDSLNIQGLNLTSTEMTKLDHSRYYLGNGSLISTVSDNGASGFGIIKDAAVTSPSYDAETSFQIHSSKDKCEEVTISDHSNSKKVDKILVKGWSESKWKTTECNELPCTIKSYFTDQGNPAYSIINVHTKASNNGTLVATCGKENIAINLNEKEERPKHPNGCKFTDVPNNDFGYYKYITALCSSQIVEGYGDTNYTQFGPDNSTLWSELTKVVNLSNNFYKTKKTRNSYPDDPWYKAYVNMAKDQGFDYISNPQFEVNRGLAYKYIVSVFWNKKLSETDAATFLRDKGISYRPNTSSLLKRGYMAEIVLKSARVSADESGLERKLPYINHLNKDIDLGKNSDIPEDNFEKTDPTDSQSEKEKKINLNVKKALRENTTVSKKGYTDNTGLAKAAMGGEKNLKPEYQNKNSKEIVLQTKSDGINKPVDTINKIEENSIVEIETPSGKTTLGITVKEKDGSGNSKIAIEKKSGKISLETVSKIENSGSQVKTQFKYEKLLPKQ